MLHHLQPLLKDDADRALLWCFPICRPLLALSCLPAAAVVSSCCSCDTVLLCSCGHVLLAAVVLLMCASAAQ